VRNHYQVNEIFMTVQGEGVLVGKSATFIRLQGCTVGCPWCDSLRTWGPLKGKPEYWRGYVKGALAGDGWTDSKQRVQWQVTDLDFAEAIVEGLKTGYGYETVVKTYDDWARHKEGKKVVYGIQCTRQEVVSQVLSDPENVEAERGFVAGFFDAEGSLNNEYQIIMWQKGIELLEKVQKYIRSQQMYRTEIHGPDSQGMYFLSLQKAKEFLEFYMPRVTRKWGRYVPVTWAKGGTRMDTAEIVATAKRYARHHVVITGGEPTLYDLDGLLYPLHQEGYYTQLETSGQQWLKGNLLPYWITWSPKESLNWDGPDQFYKHANEVKWVVDENLSWDTVWLSWLRFKRTERSLPPTFVLMPEGCPPRSEMVIKSLEWLENLSPRHQMHWRYGDRIQYRIGVR
jgi:organic radical activating enzyme